MDLELKDLEKTLQNIETARPFEDLTVVCDIGVLEAWWMEANVVFNRTKLLLLAQISMRRPLNSFPRDAGVCQVTRFVIFQTERILQEWLLT